MSMTKDMWMDACDQAVEIFCDGKLTRDQAIRELERLGLGASEARDLLDGAIA